MQSKKHIAEARARGDHVQRWSSESTYVDEDTAEVLTKHKFKDYVRTKTERVIEFNELRTAAKIWYTIYGKRRPQLKIEFGNDEKTPH